MFRIHRILFAAMAAGWLPGQITLVDLHNQGKNVDFSSAAATKPFKSGTTIPSVCAVGEMFFKVDGPPGANLYGCTSLNAWTLQQNALPAVTGNSGKIMTTDGTSLMFNSLGGDISGPATGATVTQIQGRPVSSSAPGSGQALAWNATTLRWEPSTITGGGGGASTMSQLGDLTVTRTSPTMLTIGASCSASTPCAVRFGSMVYSFAAGASVSLAAGTGSAYVYISSSGALTVGHNLTVGCTGCAAQSGVSGFPSDSIPLWSWSATSGAWDASGGADRRALLAAAPIASGAGIIVMCINGICSPSLDTSYALTHDGAISGSDLYCSDTSGSTTYSCTPPHLWPGYSAGMCFMFRPNTSSTTTATLAVAGNSGPLARLNITQADGISNPGTLITANKFYQLCYDGTQFRMSPGDSITTNPSNLKIRAIPFAIGDPAGGALTAGATTTDYLTVPFACTISAYNLLIDGGTITVKFWKVATGTSIPTAANSISTSGVGIATGTAIHSTAVSDFTTLAVAANDILAMNVTAVASAKFVNGVLECDQ